MSCGRTKVITRDSDIRFYDFRQDIVLGNKWFRMGSGESIAKEK